MKNLSNQELCDKAQAAMIKLERIAVEARRRAIENGGHSEIIAADYFYASVLKTHEEGLNLCGHGMITPSFGGK